MTYEHGYVVIENGAIMETNSNSAMKNLNVGEAVVQRKDRKLGELHFITPRNPTCLWNSILPILLGSIFYNLGTGLGWIQSWNLGGHYPELDLEGP